MIFLYSVTHFTCLKAFPENNPQTPQMMVRPENAPTCGARWLHLPTASCAAAFLAPPPNPFCVTPPAFVTKTQRVYSKGQKEQWLQVLEFVVPVHQLFVLLIGTLPVWTDTTKRNHVQQDRDLTRKMTAPQPFETSVTD
jgi:hypothetical protein